MPSWSTSTSTTRPHESTCGVEQRIDTAYRQWIRRRADIDALRELHDAVSEALDEHLAAQR